MISAVAARKARQQSQPTTPAGYTHSSESPSSIPAALARTSSKRKVRDVNTEQTSPHKKPKKPNSSKSKVQARYFLAQPQQEEDVIPVPDSDSAESSDEEASVFQVPNEGPPIGAFITPRSYSPSAPAYDAPEDDRIEGPAYISQGQAPIDPDVSTFRPTIDVNTFFFSPQEGRDLGLSTGSGALLSLSHGETVAFVGVYSLTILRGSVSLCGSILKQTSRSYRIFAPKSSPLPIIQAISTTGPSPGFPGRSQVLSDQQTAVILVEELRTGVERLGVAYRLFEDAFYSIERDDVFVKMLDGIHFVTTPKKDVKPFIVPLSWDKELSSSTSGSVYLVKGPKRSGKSTFSRTLVNRLLSIDEKVAYLECDVGQSEFTPGGMVALSVVSQPLFGPPFTHVAPPHHAVYVGSTTPQNSPSLYVSAIQSLVEVYRLELENEGIPLVVNTMGWTKGLGADLCFKIEGITQPHRTFDFGDDARALALPPTSHYSAADYRTMSILSYFHFSPRTQTWDTSLPLCAKPPYEVDISSAIDRIYLLQEDVVADELPRVLNGALVGLSSNSLSESGEKLYEQGAALPPSQCYGLALIRYASPSVLHIITPQIPPSDARVIIKGDMELPIWGFLDWRNDEQKDAPYLQWGKGEGLGAEKRRVRRNLMRKSQM